MSLLLLLTSGASTQYVTDTFTRSVVDGWSSADVGGAWTITSIPANFDVNSAEGTIVVTSHNNEFSAVLNAVSYATGDHTLKFKTDKLALGAAQKIKLQFRRVGTTYYYAWIVLNTTGTIQIQVRKVIADVDTALGTLTTVSGVTHTANQYYKIRLLVNDIIPSTTLEKGVSWLNWHTWGFGAGSDFVGQDVDADDLVAANTDWVRTRIGEDDSFAAVDGFITVLTAHNFKWNCTVRKSYPTNDLGTTTQRNNFKAWLTTFVNAYDQYVDVYEIGNEPNLPDFWTIDYTNDTTLAVGVQAYITHLQDAYDTIKAINPNAIVVNGGLANGDAENNGTSGTFGRYCDQFRLLGGYNYIDRMAFHPYASSPAANVTVANVLITKMALNATWAAKPLWFNEVGYTVHAGGGNSVPDDAAMAADTVAMLNNLRNVSGVILPIFQYTFHDANVSDNGAGLIRRNTTTYAATYLPVYNAFQALWETATPETQISLKLWQDGTTEPATYPYAISETSIMTPGAFGILARLDSGASNAPVLFTFDDLSIYSTAVTGQGIVGVATASAIAPTLGAGVTATSALAIATASAIAPTLRYDYTLISTVGVATASGLAPTPGAGINATSVIASATASAIAPTLRYGYTLTSTVGVATASGLAPTPGAGVTSTSVIASATASVIAPTPGAGVTSTSVTPLATASAIAPTLHYGYEVVATIGNATAYALASTGEGSIAITVPIGTADASGSGIVPTLAYAYTITSAIAIATASADAPTTSSSTGSEIATATASAIAPTLSGTAIAELVIGEVNVSALPPTFAGDGNVVATSGAATASILAVTLLNDLVLTTTSGVATAYFILPFTSPLPTTGSITLSDSSRNTITLTDSSRVTMTIREH